MFQHLSLERIALALFAGALTLIAATMAFARPAMIEEPAEKQVATPIYQNMTCHEAIERAESTFNAKFVIFLTPNFVSDGGSVTTDALGTCFANAPASAYNALGGQVDIHSFLAGGNSCNAKEGDVSFALFHDRKIGQSRHATLTVKNVVYNCEL
jgi:hypothetical protein